MMYIEFDNKDNILIVSLNGELDHHSAEEVRTKLDDKIERENINKIILDFKNVMFMDSSGIGVVLGRYRKIQDMNGKIALVNVNSRVNKVFELSGIYKIIESYMSIDKAILNF